MDFSEDLEKHFNNLIRGFEGEQSFDDLLAQLSIDSLVLPDLCLESNRSFFQIDTLFFTPLTNYLFEVKNYKGEYYIEGDKWYATSGYEVEDPHLQLRRTETLFLRLLRSLRIYEFNLKCHVIFPYPEFTLFNAPRNSSLILPTQLPNFLHKLNQHSGNINKKQIEIGQELRSRRLDKSPYMRIPEYNYNLLTKGFFCSECWSRMYIVKQRKLFCDQCNFSESSKQSFLRSLNEFTLLFPSKKITTPDVYEWCGETFTKKGIQRWLSSIYHQEGKGRNSHYVKDVQS